MKSKLFAGVYIGILVLFIAICVLFVMEMTRNNTLAKQVANFKGNTSQAEQIKKMQSQLEAEQQTNSQLSSQLNSLQSNYSALESQVAKIQ